MYTIHKIAEMLDYQTGSIVSRLVLDKPAGSVTLFAFDSGQGLSEHTTPFDAVVQVLEGKLSVRVSGHDHEVAAGELIVMPAGEPHALKASERAKMILTMIKK